MKRLVIALAATALMMTVAMAQNVGVSMAYFDDLFLTNLREAMSATGEGDRSKASVRGRPRRHRQATQSDSKLHRPEGRCDCGQSCGQLGDRPDDQTASRTPKFPPVYVNRQPLEPLDPNDPIVYVGSDENVSGKLEGEAIAKLLKGKGNVVIMMGELATQAAALRTEGVEKVCRPTSRDEDRAEADRQLAPQ